MKKESSKPEKLTDKAFTRLFITSILGILLSIVCLSSSTWAWFEADVSNSQNVIQSGEGKLVVSITKDQVEIENIDAGVELEAGDYTVKMTLPQGSASGYCEIYAGSDIYRSPYIPRSHDREQTLTFGITLTEKTALSIKTRWGIYSDGEADVASGATLTLPKTQSNE